MFVCTWQLHDYPIAQRVTEMLLSRRIFLCGNTAAVTHDLGQIALEHSPGMPDSL